MASITDRWWKTIKHPDGKAEKVKTSRYGVGKRWQVNARGADGKALPKVSFVRQEDAKAYRLKLESEAAAGIRRDPRDAQTLFEDFAATWLSQRTTDPLTIEETERRLKRYVNGKPLGRTPLGKIRPSTIQAWIKSLHVADSTARTVFDHVSSILQSAVDDEIIPKNPCHAKSVMAPKRIRKELVPWTHEQVGAVYDGIAERYQPLVIEGAWLGLRPGETYGLSPDDIDWLRGKVIIRRQVKLVGYRRVFAPPKGGKEAGSKEREVPVEQHTLDALAAYLAKYPPVEVTLPWREPNGKPVTVKLLLTTPDGEALHSKATTRDVWYPALEAAGIARVRTNGAHALRHYYASVLLDEGESIKAIAAYLGHADPGYTLRVYTHLMPTSETRTRGAIAKSFAEVQASRERLRRRRRDLG